MLSATEACLSCRSMKLEAIEAFYFKSITIVKSSVERADFCPWNAAMRYHVVANIPDPLGPSLGVANLELRGPSGGWLADHRTHTVTVQILLTLPNSSNPSSLLRHKIFQKILRRAARSISKFLLFALNLAIQPKMSDAE